MSIRGIASHFTDAMVSPKIEAVKLSTKPDDCLLDSFKGTNCNYNYTTNHRICPYCRMGSGFLPMRPGYSYVKNVHPPSCRFVQKIQCKGCYKSGKSKGLPCTTMVDKNIGYCKRHIPKK